MKQQNLMTHSPENGLPKPYPSHAAQWRMHNGDTAFLHNPWTGKLRTAQDIGTDTFGHAISDCPQQAPAPDAAPARTMPKANVVLDSDVARAMKDIGADTSARDYVEATVRRMLNAGYRL